MKMKKSWGWVLFWLIIFWPVGLFMLFAKLRDKSTLMGGKTTAATVAACTLIVFSVLMLIGNIEKLLTDFEVTLFFIAWMVGGVLILLKIYASKAKAKRYKRYLNVIVNTGERSMERIASAMSVTYATAQRDIQAMIDGGFLKGAYIHQGNRAIVLRWDVQAQRPFTGMNIPQSQPAEPQRFVLKCPNCGANNVVTKGEVTECEYCETPLVG